MKRKKESRQEYLQRSNWISGEKQKAWKSTKPKQWLCDKAAAFPHSSSSPPVSFSNSFQKYSVNYFINEYKRRINNIHYLKMRAGNGFCLETPKGEQAGRRMDLVAPASLVAAAALVAAERRTDLAADIFGGRFWRVFLFGG